MIKSIEKIQNMGVYRDYKKPLSMADFKKYNLFYGWNGSGKSTLSRLMQMLENKNTDGKCQFKILQSDGNSVTEKNVQDFNENIYIFNEDFIKKNIDWNGKIESILLLSETKIDEINELKALKDELDGTDKTKGLVYENETENKKHEIELAELGKILTATAKNIKGQLQVIATTDSYYSNYNRTKVETFISDNRLELQQNKKILSDDDMIRYSQAAKPFQKEDIVPFVYLDNIEEIRDKENKLDKLVKSAITAKVIEELLDNKQLSDWVEKGLIINENRKTCAFCGGIIIENRIEELENHYNDAMKKLKICLNENIEFFKLLKSNNGFIKIDLEKFYPEFKTQAESLQESILETSKELNIGLESAITILTSKLENPFTTFEYTGQNISIKIDEFIEKIYNLNHLIACHNKKNKEFEDITKAAKKMLEGHYINVQLQELTYFQKEIQYDDNQKKIAMEKEIIKEKSRRVELLEAELSNEALGAEEFNLKLEKFLGYGDIRLVFDKVKKGYKVVRNGAEEAENLSEGEKTSIAFLYFITKLHENGNNVENSILVIDDPISSFDSNKIFHAYAFLKSECKNAKQLFVLTHNYSYYSLMLGWFKKETIKILDKKQPNYALYKIEVDILDGVRNGFIRSAGAGMTQSSEYDYVFYNVYKFKDNVLNKEELIYSGNVARKLVESFLSFKFPAQRGDLKALLDKAFPGKEDEIEREEIYRFINVYSHHKFIDVTEQLEMDILDACVENVIGKVLDMIKRLDEEHYIAMIKRAEDECCLK